MKRTRSPNIKNLLDSLTRVLGRAHSEISNGSPEKAEVLLELAMDEISDYAKKPQASKLAA